MNATAVTAVENRGFDQRTERPRKDHDQIKICRTRKMSDMATMAIDGCAGEH